MKFANPPINIPGSTLFQKMDNLFRAVIAVPKAEIDRREKEWQKQNGKRKRSVGLYSQPSFFAALVKLSFRFANNSSERRLISFSWDRYRSSQAQLCALVSEFFQSRSLVSRMHVLPVALSSLHVLPPFASD